MNIWVETLHCQRND